MKDSEAKENALQQFVFWGMGSVFSGGNTNNIAKINNENVSTQDFMDYLNRSGLSQRVIK